MNTMLQITALLALVGCLGCEASAPADATAQSTMQAPPPPTPEAPSDKAAEAPPAADAPAQNPGAAAPAAAAATPEPPAADPVAPGEGDSVAKAEVGVGVKGKDYGGPGFVTTPIETLFRTNDRIAFEIQIPNSMKIYKADHNNKGPKTHEEFMSVIIKENGVALPDLPAGSTYWYDVKAEELLVRTPKP